jgi:membrane-associated phospholipid phosphatase
MPARSRTALLGAGISLALLALIWLLAFRTGLGQHADQSIFNGFAGLQRPRVNGLAKFVAGLCDPEPFVALGAAIVAVALARRRPRIALAVAVLLVGANVTTQLLKPLLAAPRAHSLLSTVAEPAFGSWPSGHATAAMSLALGLVLAVPARRRPIAGALGALFAVAVSYSFLTLGWHYPSDVLGGFLVAVTWTQLAVAGVVLADARHARRAEPSARHSVAWRAALAPSAWAVAGVAAVAGLVALWRPHEVIAYASGHAAFVAGAAAIGALAFGLSSAVMLSMRR